MKRIRVSIATAMFIVVLFALAFVALKDETGSWVSVLFTLVTGLVLTATVGLFYSKSPALRGFVVFFWGYWLVSARWTESPRPLSSHIATEVLISLHRLEPVPANMPIPMSFYSIIESPLRGTSYNLPSKFNSAFVLAHIVTCLLMGGVGALLARIIASRSERRPA